MPKGGPTKKEPERIIPDDAREFIRLHDQAHPEKPVDRKRVTVVDARKRIRPKQIPS